WGWWGGGREGRRAGRSSGGPVEELVERCFDAISFGGDTRGQGEDLPEPHVVRKPSREVASIRRGAPIATNVLGELVTEPDVREGPRLPPSKLDDFSPRALQR